MKKALSVVAVLLLLAAGLYCLIQAKKMPAPVSETSNQILPDAKPVKIAPPKNVTNVPAVVPIASSPVAAPPAPNLAVNAGLVSSSGDSNAPTDISPKIAMANVRTAIRQYGDMWGGNPVGTNPEIAAALNGNNPKHINFINAEAGMRINGKGELIDPWGTPYFFHQISGTDMEIHSAGLDKVMWTSDDLVVK